MLQIKNFLKNGVKLWYNFFRKEQLQRNVSSNFTRRIDYNRINSQLWKSGWNVLLEGGLGLTMESLNSGKTVITKKTI